MNTPESLNNETSNQSTEWDTLSDVKFTGNIQPEPWEESLEEVENETEPDINGVPQTLWRGERLYLNNIDEVGQRSLSTSGYERHGNNYGTLSLARDKNFASKYAIGTDGVKFYDGPLPKEQIPIGVIYKINNQDNHLNISIPEDDEPLPFGPFAGKYREFHSAEIPPSDYSVEEFYIMDDFLQKNDHERSDFRKPMEVYKIKDQKDIPATIEKIKARIDELDKQR